MNSFDTNILVYGLNKDCEEHQQAYDLLQTAMEKPENWIISDHVYLEFYRLVRNPAVLEKPLTAEKALELLDYYRNTVGWLHCSYHTSSWDEMIPLLKDNNFPAKRVFDLCLAATLKHNNVDILYTRSVNDFKELHWFEVIDPIAN